MWKEIPSNEILASMSLFSPSSPYIPFPSLLPSMFGFSHIVVGRILQDSFFVIVSVGFFFFF